MAELHRRVQSDEGLGLIEVIISMVIFGLAITATTPMLLGGLQASRTAQLNTKARALGQERLEKMRNLPYHVAFQNGRYIDVLDIYFRDLQASTGPDPSFAADPCDRRTYAAGVYSCLIKNKIGVPYKGFSQLVEVRFLTETRTLVTPRSTYTSQSAGNDMPVSNLLGVNVTTSWASAGKSHSYRLQSHIVNALPGTTSLEANLKVTPVSITSDMVGGDLAQLQAGLLSMAGDVATGSNATISAVTAMAGLASGQTIYGARETRSAPPSQGALNPSDSNGYSLGTSCATLCFGQTAITGDDTVRVLVGDPMVASASNPVTVGLRRTGSNQYKGFSFSNADSTNGLDPALRLQGPFVSAGSGNTTDVVVSQGYLDTSGTGATSTVESGSFRMPMLQLFPTSFAPDGLVQIQVDSASLTCQSGSGSSSVTAAWQVRVRWYNSSTGQYVEYQLRPGSAALPDPSTLVVDPTSGATLGTWIASWSGLTSTAGISQGTGARAVGTVPSLVSIITAPTRTGSPSSAINLAVGAMACLALDVR
jgi:type II secretory pathway pseudopilin PulG